MTDEQIINRWKHERELSECVCSYFVDQVELSLVNETIDLIIRQQAEIERLQSMNQAKLDTIHDLQVEIERLNKEVKYWEVEAKEARADINQAVAEAVKEFAERLKEKAYPFPCAIGVENAVTIRAINDLVKEMVGENNA